MFRSLLSIVILFVFVTHTSAQRKHEKFEKEIFEFKYSLYPMLKDYEESGFIVKKIEANHPFMVKVNEYYNKNKTKIYQLQRHYLLKYAKNKIDTNNFKKDTIYDDVVKKGLHKDIEDYWKSLKTNGEAVMKIINLNPCQYAYQLKQIYASYSDLTMLERSVYLIKDQIARQKVITEEVAPDLWVIWFDHYFYAYKFIYNQKTDEMKLICKFIRKE